jgi:hypothetical protein
VWRVEGARGISRGSESEKPGEATPPAVSTKPTDPGPVPTHSPRAVWPLGFGRFAAWNFPHTPSTPHPVSPHLHPIWTFFVSPPCDAVQSRRRGGLLVRMGLRRVILAVGFGHVEYDLPTTPLVPYCRSKSQADSTCTAAEN